MTAQPMSDIQIPPEALEAAAMAIAQNDGCPLDLFPVCHNEYVACDCRNEARAALTTQEKPWPEGFFKIERSIMDRCASEGCGQVPNMRLEVGGVWSVYCEPCARKIAALTAQEKTDD